MGVSCCARLLFNGGRLFASRVPGPVTAFIFLLTTTDNLLILLNGGRREPRTGCTSSRLVLR
eukprot:6373347-Amphidinium_carterae.1